MKKLKKLILGEGTEYYDDSTYKLEYLEEENELIDEYKLEIKNSNIDYWNKLKSNMPICIDDLLTDEFKIANENNRDEPYSYFVLVCKTIVIYTEPYNLFEYYDDIETEINI
jgi:hypothetical protein